MGASIALVQTDRGTLAVTKSVVVISRSQIGAYDDEDAIYELVQSTLTQVFLHNGVAIHDLVRPGQHVLIKPNLLYHYHPQELSGLHSMVVHGAVLRPVIDAFADALDGQGQITVAESPVPQTDFERVVKAVGVADVIRDAQQHWSVPVHLLDVRRQRLVIDYAGWAFPRLQSLPGDPLGYVEIDLGRISAFHEIADHWRDLRNARALHVETTNQHTLIHHRYTIPRSILSADVIINIAKLKTHTMGGTTLSLKNAVGICIDKDRLPHYRHNHDEYPAEYTQQQRRRVAVNKFLVRWSKRIPQLEKLRSYKRLINNLCNNAGLNSIVMWGAWHGNDTLWRMVVDLNRILYFADAHGKIHDTPQREVLHIIDGIVGGDGEGPIRCHPKPAGVILASLNPVALDMVATHLMGLDHRQVQVISRCNEHLSTFSCAEAQIECYENGQPDRVFDRLGVKLLWFRPPHGWLGHLELSDQKELSSQYDR